MSEIELKACPFCGGEAGIRKWQDEDLWSHAIVEWQKAHCTECECEGISSCPGYDPDTVQAWNTRAPQWQPIESAPADELVVVCWLDDEDTENPERHEFDYIEDGMWVNHANLVEHAQAVAPPGSRVPKDHAPYQWWMPLPAPPEVEG
ncbi:hypothetical protein I5U90_03215 [Stenotrophomonas maltophilia]|jgi:hypothetical protein|uniref:hypothetical protein n=1 Tax=Stenotrophomonas maltophilia TaxID=40324 RepID=UPI00130F9B47|nr:hypothetical protein [Stenotrophomonas maltophilia]MBA0225181.1 hypothetical protein [Stenotrophomonas maltophilia]MBA0365301.1 hypothetical protein [Stenotrophomonas maltophilia]MBH1672053.1 hypothetical protein [Stenotrophomonas maltophilia]